MGIFWKYVSHRELYMTWQGRFRRLDRGTLNRTDTQMNNDKWLLFALKRQGPVLIPS
jgi:hypothetical protein